MRRFFRKTVAVTIGLALGWVAAGYMPDSSMFAGRQSHASEVDTQHHDTSVTLSEKHHSTGTESHHGPAAAGAGGHHDDPDPGQRAAGRLKPIAGVDGVWYCKVLLAVLGLWVAALVLGYPAWKLRGPDLPEAPDPHDDHGHGASHGHDHHAQGSTGAPNAHAGAH